MWVLEGNRILESISSWSKKSWISRCEWIQKERERTSWQLKVFYGVFGKWYGKMWPTSSKWVLRDKCSEWTSSTMPLWDVVLTQFADPDLGRVTRKRCHKCFISIQLSIGNMSLWIEGIELRIKFIRMCQICQSIISIGHNLNVNVIAFVFKQGHIRVLHWRNW